ncbi:enoyl-CoA hydratase [Seongchinamella sediminis]|uniref:Enoyl-CoA hydratase n=1 Tax=Seongchinamella sediminis TaxID=2283635 RepID=A0A3L7DUA2_9GAMM|nr:enoyl-CoA hydratase-related protein [Seongchinamella sediminis]RLQ20686.1 enoyl-CoA hydratase [Seongchinamella sediminis]
MEYQEIKYTRDGPVTIITFNRPEVKNCIGPRTHRELIDAFNRFRTDDAARVAVITGAGDSAFCAGGDLKSSFDKAGATDHPDPEQAMLCPVEPADVARHNRGEAPGILGPSRWTDIYKPIIAAVNGVAYAGGFEWACFADMRIVEDHASFGITCRRWNIGLADGGTQRLPRIVGMGRALELIITGKVIDAQEAYRIGLANELVPSGTSLHRAVELARFIATLPQPAILADKEAAVRGFGQDLREGLRIEAECYNRLLTSPDSREQFLDGLRRFNERDHPDRIEGQVSTPGIVRSEMEP